MGLVFAMAIQGTQRYPGVQIDDAISECQSALLRAATTFNPSLGFQFSTYACNAMHRAIHRLANPKARRVWQLVTDEEHSPDRSDILPSVVADVDTGILPTELRGMVDKLEEADRLVISLRFFEGLTLEETGRRMQFSKERARQIQERALATLRAACEEALN